MKKFKVLFILFVMMMVIYTPSVDAEELCKVTKGTGFSVGDEITCGTESFYVVSSDETNVKLFAKYNLEVGYTCEAPMSCISLAEASGIQSGKCDDYTCLPSETAHKSYHESFNNAVSAYKNYLANSVGLTNAEVSIIDMDTLNSLGCKIEKQVINDGNQFLLNGSCTDSGKTWLYNTSYSISFTDEYSAVAPFGMKNTGEVKDSTVPMERGVRVVVKIPKNDISIKNKEQESKATESSTKNSQTVDVADTFKTAYIGYCIGTIILILGIMVIYQSYRKDKKEIKIKK